MACTSTLFFDGYLCIKDTTSVVFLEAWATDGQKLYLLACGSEQMAMSSERELDGFHSFDQLVSFAQSLPCFSVSNPPTGDRDTNQKLTNSRCH